VRKLDLRVAGRARNSDANPTPDHEPDARMHDSPRDVSRPRVSVALITRNEHHNIRDCLRSVAWADEIVVVDQASTDGTAEAARAAGAKVIAAPDWRGFGHQKNLAVDACTGDWILSLDADERIPAPLAQEIAAAVGTARVDAFEIPRTSSFCGRFMKHGGWTDDHVLRLFKRGRGRFSPDRVHERLLVDGAVGRLTTPMLHFSVRTLDDALDKVNRYSTEGALMLAQRGARPSVLVALAHGFASFVRTYVLKLGFLDGSHGLMLAIANAEGSYYRYVKAMLASRQRRDAE
jgi:glycosyltransferase involved in cell wall biosynthesis